MNGLNAKANRMEVLVATVLATLGMGCLTSAAHADIIVRNGADIPLTANDTIVGTELHVGVGVGEVRFDISGNGFEDGRLQVLSDNRFFARHRGDSNLLWVPGELAVASLSAGEEIPGTTYDLSADNGGRIMMEWTADGEGNVTVVDGDWLPGVVGYIGARITIDGNSHYGWMEVRLDVDPFDTAGTNLVVQRVAYQSNPGVSILAGEVPEPASLALLGAGGLLLLSRRRAWAV